ncbi:MAG: hypothetical protein JO209_01760 [Acidisphaera sp.]|nr:hypothetical protein [Acidisphaera sp.]
MAEVAVAVVVVVVAVAVAQAAPAAVQAGPALQAEPREPPGPAPVGSAEWAAPVGRGSAEPGSAPQGSAALA